MKRKVYVVGAGIGGSRNLTVEATGALNRCGCVFGEKQLLAGLHLSCLCLEQTEPEKVVSYLTEHPEMQEAAVVTAGDCDAQLAARLRSLLGDTACVELFAGIGPVSYFCAKMGLVSAGAVSVVPDSPAHAVCEVRTHARVFLQTGAQVSAQEICAGLAGGGLGSLPVWAGEFLGTEQEKISVGKAAAFSVRHFAPCSLLYLENPEPVCTQVRTCIPDEAFLHSGVSMTKCEVRAASVGKLCLERDSVVYDIGCGTGSVSVECALQAQAGVVYAIDKNRAALKLTEENRRRFGVYNVKPVEGEAPAVLRGLPVPDRVFIGGSTGNLPDILEAVLQKNPRVRIVLNAISLETVMQAVGSIERFGLRDVEIAQISVAKSRPTGGHKLMQAQNPVYILSGYGSGNG